MTEWLLEEGIGETRALLLREGSVVAVRTEREGSGLRLGTIAEAIAGAPTPSGDRTRIAIGGSDALLRGRAPEGIRLRVEIIREMIPERGNPKPALAVPAPDKPLRDGPRLADALAAEGCPITRVEPHGPDRLEEHGWSEVLEEARTGLVAFAGGMLRIDLAAAMTVIDVDGGLAPGPLALAGAAAAARAIERLGIGGSIGIDLPTQGGKAARQAAAAELDRLLPPPFERTAVNGFGFVQIVRPRQRASLLETVQSTPALTAALALLRLAARDRRPGGLTLCAAPGVAAILSQRPEWIARLERLRGAAIGLRAEAGRAISAGHAEPLATN